MLPRADPAPDGELIRRILGGESVLFAVIMRRYNQRLYRAVRAIVGRDDEAEDVVQQAYVAAYSNLSRFRGEARLSTWLTRIAINEALGRMRKSQRAEIALVDGGAERMEEPRPTPEDATYRKELASLLEQHIDELPESLRVVFVMRDVEELDTAETAASLEISEEAVRVRLHRARHLLQERLSRILESATEAFRFDGERCDRIVQGVAEKLGL
jgi:RNA polymerase sigma-70 factor (ECF subfamily)